VEYIFIYLYPLKKFLCLIILNFPYHRWLKRQFDSRRKHWWKPQKSWIFALVSNCTNQNTLEDVIERLCIIKIRYLFCSHDGAKWETPTLWKFLRKIKYFRCTLKNTSSLSIFLNFSWSLETTKLEVKTLTFIFWVNLTWKVRIW
jgi:hypothetical protein